MVLLINLMLHPSSGGNGGALDGANIAFYIYMDCRYRIS